MDDGFKANPSVCNYLRQQTQEPYLPKTDTTERNQFNKESPWLVQVVKDIH